MMARAAAASATIPAAAGAAAVDLGNMAAGAADTAVMVDQDPYPDTVRSQTGVQPGRQVEKTATAAAMSTPANRAEEAAVVSTEEAAVVVSAAMPGGAVTASTKPPTVSPTFKNALLFLFQFNLQTSH
jgi:hypothetical protein